MSLRESIARMRKRGYTFISLDEAMQDPAYERPDTFAGSGGSWLSRTATVMGKPATPETAAFDRSCRSGLPNYLTEEKAGLPPCLFSPAKAGHYVPRKLDY